MRDRLIRICLSLPVIDQLAYLLLGFYSRLNHQANLEIEKLESDGNSKIWKIRIAAPRNGALSNWGDYFFAQNLSAGFKKNGVDSEILLRGDKANFKKGDVNIVIRGLLPSKPVKNAVNVLWVISHPDQVSTRELRKFDFVFAASEIWADEMSKKSKKKIGVLLQATNADKFQISQSSKKISNSVVFAGNTVGRRRQIVMDFIALGFDVQIYGRGWEKFVDPRFIKGKSISESELVSTYQQTNIGLNDHWPDMKKHGFISNRLFDIVSCGTFAVSDNVAGIDAIFGECVLTYESVDDLKSLSLDLLATEKTKKLISKSAEISKLHTFENRARTLIEAVT